MALSEPGKKLSGHTKDKSENDMSATALGYVGHVSISQYTLSALVDHLCIQNLLLIAISV